MPRLTTARLSITIAVTGLIIGGTAGGYIIGTITLALNSLQLAGAVPSQARPNCPNAFGSEISHARNTGLRPVQQRAFKPVFCRGILLFDSQLRIREATCRRRHRCSPKGLDQPRHRSPGLLQWLNRDAANPDDVTLGM